MAKFGYESDFSPDGRRFAILDENGLKIWNTTENRLEQQYVPKLHLSRPYTCFVWFQACSGKVSLNKLMYIALGTSKGGVDLYSHASNELDRKLNGNGHQGAVTCICLYDNTTLYTAGEDFQIFEWSLDTCSSVRSFGIVKESIPTSIICLPLSNSLLIGCKRLQQWSLEKKPKIIATLTGHTADISSMKEFHFADTKEEYVATTANNNREIYLWKIGSKTIPTQTFLMEHVGSVVSCSVVESKLTIAAVCKENSGVVHLFVVDDISDINKRPNKPKVTLIVASDSGGQVNPIPIVAASTSFSKPSSSNILIGYGRSPKISFEDVRYNPKETKQTLERVDPRCQVNRQENFKEMSKVHAPNTNDPSTHRAKGGSKNQSSERPLEEIVIAMDTSKTVDDKGYSMVEALKQALHNNETTNIRNVLATKDVEVIRSTLKKLPPQYIFSLIDQLTLLTHKKTANVQIAVRWLKLLLQIHASLLIALGKDELNERFGALIGIIDNRTNSLAKLSALTGRLDLLLHQMKRGSDDDQQLHHGHVLEFVEEKSDDEEHTAVNGKSDSDGGASTEEDDVSMGISSNEDSDGNDSDGVSH